MNSSCSSDNEGFIDLDEFSSPNPADNDIIEDAHAADNLMSLYAQERLDSEDDLAESPDEFSEDENNDGGVWAYRAGGEVYMRFWEALEVPKFDEVTTAFTMTEEDNRFYDELMHAMNTSDDPLVRARTDEELVRPRKAGLFDLPLVCQPRERELVFPRRKLHSELYEVPEYEPFFARHPMVPYLTGSVSKLELWNAALRDRDSLQQFFKCKEHLANGVLSWCNTLYHKTDPLVLKDIWRDLEYRVRYASGKLWLYTNGTTHGAALYGFWPHKKCSVTWNLDIPRMEEGHHAHMGGCPCGEIMYGISADRTFPSWCCYTPALPRHLYDDDGNNIPFSVAVDELRECIRIIQRLYLPLTNGDSLFLDANRFSGNYQTGLIWWPNISWADVFCKVEQYLPETGFLAENTSTMRTSVQLLLFAEWFCRPSETAAVPWEYLDVRELLPYDRWHMITYRYTNEAGNFIFGEGWQDGFRSKLGDIRQWEIMMVRSVSDAYEDRMSFRCDRCDGLCCGQSVVVFPIKGRSITSVAGAINHSKNWATIYDDYCTDNIDIGMHAMPDAEHDATIGDCCAFHRRNNLVEIEYDTTLRERVCFKCLSNPKEFLMISRATMDGHDNSVEHTMHNGAWWYDARKLRNLRSSKKMKRAVQ